MLRDGVALGVADDGPDVPGRAPCGVYSPSPESSSSLSDKDGADPESSAAACAVRLREAGLHSPIYTATASLTLAALLVTAHAAGAALVRTTNASMASHRYSFFEGGGPAFD